MDPIYLLRQRVKELEGAEKSLRTSSNHFADVKKAHGIIERTNQTLQVVQEHAQGIVIELEKLRNVAADFMKAIPDLLDLNIKEMTNEPSPIFKPITGVSRKLQSMKKESSNSSYQSNRRPVEGKLPSENNVLIALFKKQNELLAKIINTAELFLNIQVGYIHADATIKDFEIQISEWNNVLEEIRNTRNEIEEGGERKRKGQEMENERKEEERKKQEQVEKILKEKERNRKIDEQIQGKEEKERLLKEEEERRKKEDTTRRRKKEQEGVFKEEEGRRIKEKKERLKKEKEERIKGKEEEEKKRLEEEALHKRFQEKQKRPNPKNWTPYFRKEVVEKKLSREEEDRKKKEDEKLTEECRKKEKQEILFKEEEEKEKERSRKKEEERLFKEEEERKKKEEEERKKKEVEKERLRNEEEQTKSEERGRKDTNRRSITKNITRITKASISKEVDSMLERRKMREDEGRRKEEQERLIKEIEESKNREKEKERSRKKEEEERLFKEEEERNKKEEETERLRNEEEQTKRVEGGVRKLCKILQQEQQRQNPKNWTPFIYYRSSGKVLERNQLQKRTFHGGVSAVVYAIPNSITKDSLECLSTDDDYEIRLCRKNSDEKIIGSLTTICTRSNEDISLEVPMQIYVPYADIPVTHIPQIVLTLNSKKQALIKQLSTWDVEDTPGISYVGCEINNFTRLQMYVIAVKRPEELWYNGTRIEHKFRENELKIVIHQGESRSPVLVSVQDHHIEKDEFKRRKKLNKELANINSTRGCFRITTNTSSELNIDIEANEKEDGKDTVIRSAHRSIGASWKVISPIRKEKYTIFTLPDKIVQEDIVVMVVPPATPDIEMCDAAIAVYQHCQEDIVTLILLQKWDNEADAKLECVRRNEVKNRLKELKKLGYSQGPSESSEFCIKDGEKILIGFHGNVTSDLQKTNNGELTSMVYHSHMHTARLSMHLTVDDKYQHPIVKSKYQGFLTWNVPDGGIRPSRSGQLTIYLPKTRNVMADTKPPKEEEDWEAIALSKFIGKYTRTDNPLCFKWKIVLRKLLSSTINYNETSCSGKAYAQKFTEFILKWMINEEKVGRVDKLLQCFEDNDKDEMAEVIRTFVKEHTSIFNDKALVEMTKTIGKEWRFFGINLGLSASTLKRMEGSHKKMEHVIFSMLKTARISEKVIENSENLRDFLLDAARRADGGIELINFIESKLSF